MAKQPADLAARLTMGAILCWEEEGKKKKGPDGDFVGLIAGDTEARVFVCLAETRLQVRSGDLGSCAP